ncbi:MAG: hypothetical protein KF690_11000, partial [Bacteroidetes bacterium]|nr:hypothetical protein [Bacteroidota bacterium]
MNAQQAPKASADNTSQAATPARTAYPDMFLQPQDAALMDNTQPMPFSALDRLHLYEPIMYYSTDSLARRDLPYYGMELNASLYELNPELVRNRMGHASIDMYGLLALSIKAIKELKDKHETLAAKVGGYEARFTSIETQLEDLRKYLKSLFPYTEKTDMAFDKMVELEKQLKALRA